MIKRKWFVAGLAACVWSLALATGNDAQQPGHEQIHRMVGHLAKPERSDFSEDLLSLLLLPDGFEINVFARGLGNPRMLAVGRDGVVYVTRREHDDFLTGFLLDEGQSYFGRPAGLAIARDGSLLFSDDTNGVIYRIAYREARARR